MGAGLGRYAGGMHADPIVTAELETPLGVMVVGGTSEGICLLEFEDRRALAGELRELPELLGREVVRGAAADLPVLGQMERELHEYFAGERRVFEVPLVTPGTAF